MAPPPNSRGLGTTLRERDKPARPRNSDSDLTIRRATRWGLSLGISIPRHVARQLGIFRGDWIALRVVGRTLVIRKFLAEELLPLDACEQRAAAEQKARLDNEQ